MFNVYAISKMVRISIEIAQIAPNMLGVDRALRTCEFWLQFCKIQIKPWQPYPPHLLFGSGVPQIDVVQGLSLWDLASITPK